MTKNHPKLPFSAAQLNPDQDENHKVCVFLTYEGAMVLVLRQHPDGVVSVEPVGGKKKIGETVPEACVREIREELGVEVESHSSAFHHLGTDTHPVKGYDITYLAGRHVSGVPKNALPEEHLDILHVPLGDNFRAEALKQAEYRLLDLGITSNGPVQLRVPQEILSRYQKMASMDPDKAAKHNDFTPV